MLERGLAFERARPPAPEVERMFARFLAHYDTHLADRSRAFPETAAALEELRGCGAILVVCTNKLERFSTKLLQALGLADHFALVAGADTFAMRKPDPGHLLTAISRAGGRSSAA